MTQNSNAQILLQITHDREIQKVTNSEIGWGSQILPSGVCGWIDYPQYPCMLVLVPHVH